MFSTPTLSALSAEKAPAGYGLGKDAETVCYDCNTALLTGWYALGGADMTANKPPYNMIYGTMTVERRWGKIVQTVRYENLTVVRYSNDSGSSWSEWEWVNPPMDLGVEYRTTKRYLGKPVYTKAVDFGALPNATTKYVTYPNAEATMISLHGVLSNGNSFTSGYNWDKTTVGKFWVDNAKWSIRIQTEGDASSVTAVVIAEYVY